MSVVNRHWTVCLLIFINLLASRAGWGGEPSPPLRQPIDYLRTEIESRKAELAEILRQRAEHKTTTDKQIAALKTVNSALKKETDDLKKVISRHEESTRLEALVVTGEMKRLSVMVRALTAQVGDLRKTIDPAFQPKPGDNPPATPTQGDRASPKVEPDENPFD